MWVFFIFLPFRWLFSSRDHGAVWVFLGSDHGQKSTACPHLVVAGFQKGAFSCGKSLQHDAECFLPSPALHWGCACPRNADTGALYTRFVNSAYRYKKGLWTWFLHRRHNVFLQQEVQRFYLDYNVIFLNITFSCLFALSKHDSGQTLLALYKSHWRHQH